MRWSAGRPHSGEPKLCRAWRRTGAAVTAGGFGFSTGVGGAAAFDADGSITGVGDGGLTADLTSGSGRTSSLRVLPLAKRGSGRPSGFLESGLTRA